MSTVAALLVNPSAGKGRAGQLVEPTRAALHRAGVDVLVLAGRSPAESVALTRTAVADGVGVVVALGGDGLVHWAVQALAGTPVPLAIVPAGTGNDFAQVVGSPRDLSALAAAVVAGRTAEIDVVRAVPDHPTPGEDAGDDPDGGRWFTGVLGAGFDSAVNERANRMHWPRGPRRYDLAVFAELYRLRSRSVVLTLDGQRHEFEVTLVAVGNGPQYGGGFRICPDAELTDGLLDVCVVGPLSRAQLIRFKPLARTGRHVDLPMVQVLRGRQVRLAAPDVVAYADGERVGPLPVTLTCVPGALRVLVP